MPLKSGFSRKVISDNISELTHHGSRPRPHNQILAIALSEADKSKRQHRAGGGSLAAPQVPFFERNEAHELQAAGDSFHPSGLFHSDVAGRTDRLPYAVKADSFVFPADTISALGQGNTLAGSKIMQAILSTGPYGASLPHRRASGGNAAPNGNGVSHVMVAGGEYLAEPNDLRNVGYRRRAKGKTGVPLDRHADLREGHKWAREFCANLRSHAIKFLKSAPKPKT